MIGLTLVLLASAALIATLAYLIGHDLGYEKGREDEAHYRPGAPLLPPFLPYPVPLGPEPEPWHYSPNDPPHRRSWGDPASDPLADLRAAAAGIEAAYDGPTRCGYCGRVDGEEHHAWCPVALAGPPPSRQRRVITDAGRDLILRAAAAGRSAAFDPPVTIRRGDRYRVTATITTTDDRGADRENDDRPHHARPVAADDEHRRARRPRAASTTAEGD